MKKRAAYMFSNLDNLLLQEVLTPKKLYSCSCLKGNFYDILKALSRFSKISNNFQPWFKVGFFSSIFQVWKISALVTGLYFAAFLFYSLREDDWGGSADYLSSRTNLHLRIDFVIFFLHGLMAYCFPATIATFQVPKLLIQIYIHVINF